jgi:hypothetical protein
MDGERDKLLGRCVDNGWVDDGCASSQKYSSGQLSKMHGEVNEGLS